MLNKIGFQFSGGILSIGDFTVPITIAGLVEIIIFSIASYYLILWIKKTKAWSLLKGAMVLLAAYILADVCKLTRITAIFRFLANSLVIAVVVILQPEIRRALEQLGNRRLLRGIFSSGSTGFSSGLDSHSVDSIVRAMALLGKNRVGALVVVERGIQLDEYIETGISLDAVITTALLEQIFEHNTPLHDGAVIIRNNRIVSATCYLPLSQNTAISKELGTRHRAGLGISEVSDCITLIASEETGGLSVAMDGKLKRDVTVDEMREILTDVRLSQEEKKTAKGKQKISLNKGKKGRNSDE